MSNWPQMGYSKWAMTLCPISASVLQMLCWDLNSVPLAVHAFDPGLSAISTCAHTPIFHAFDEGSRLQVVQENEVHVVATTSNARLFPARCRCRQGSTSQFPKSWARKRVSASAATATTATAATASTANTAHATSSRDRLMAVLLSASGQCQKLDIHSGPAAQDAGGAGPIIQTGADASIVAPTDELPVHEGVCYWMDKNNLEELWQRAHRQGEPDEEAPLKIYQDEMKEIKAQRDRPPRRMDSRQEIASRLGNRH
eukprot:1473660-Amphidinium_carterae.3